MLNLLGIVFIIMCIFMILSYTKNDDIWWTFGIASMFIMLVIVIVGCFSGFVNYPATEGVHQGVITAIDLEGIYFRRYEVYLKSNGFTTNSDGNVSNETRYLLYDYEKELADELKKAIGKEIKLYYGHDGGYIGWNSCGTYHIKSFEIVESEENK